MTTASRVLVVRDKDSGQVRILFRDKSNHNVFRKGTDVAYGLDPRWLTRANQYFE